MAPNWDYIFPKIFGRAPRPEELKQLGNGRMNEKIFTEWLMRKLGDEHIPEDQLAKPNLVATFVENYKKDHPECQTLYDIFWAEVCTTGQNATNNLREMWLRGAPADPELHLAHSPNCPTVPGVMGRTGNRSNGGPGTSQTEAAAIRRLSKKPK